jgi:DNA mismatch endonuclease (patch repair protein)
MAPNVLLERETRTRYIGRVHIPSADTTARMKRIRRSGTAPEQSVRRTLRQLGISFRACVRGLPGTPDLVNRGAGWAIFVNGCFWHGHGGCKKFTVPKTNTTFWIEKIKANKARDARKVRQLRKLGFRVVTIWQCEAANDDRLREKIAKRLRGPRNV